MFLHKGLWLATLILSLKTGLILGTSWLSFRAIVLVASCFGGGIVLLAQVFANHRMVLARFLDQYTFVGALLAGMLLIYLGLQGTEFAGGQQAGREHAGVGRRLQGTEFAGGQQGAGKPKTTYFFAFLPCPFCMAALAFTVIAMAPVAGVSTAILGKKVALLFTILVIATALAARRLTTLTKYRPIAVFNQLLFFTGVVTLVFSFTIPNFVQAMAVPLGPIPGSEYLSKILHVASQSFLIPCIIGLILFLVLSLMELGSFAAELRQRKNLSTGTFLETLQRRGEVSHWWKQNLQQAIEESHF
ncbi:MAG: DUF2162 domain-containing protein [Clostridia bacterium]|nr:DUF2162 domain-containing protein [Clostridia bacterium]